MFSLNLSFVLWIVFYEHSMLPMCHGYMCFGRLGLTFHLDVELANGNGLLRYQIHLTCVLGLRVLLVVPPHITGKLVLL